jgi:hypothetical protein
VKEPVETKSFLEKNLIAVIAVSILVFFILCIIGVLIWDKKRKENKILADINNKVKKPDIIISGGKNVSNQEYSSNIGRSFVSAGDELDKTVVLHQDETIFDRTIMLMPENSLWSIKLKDIRNNRIFVKELGNELILGRVGNGTDQSRIVIDYETSVSKRHCRIYIKNKDVYIMDMGSSNHTFVNDQMIEDEHLLKDGDVIGIGNLKLEVSLVQLAA